MHFRSRSSGEIRESNMRGTVCLPIRGQTNHILFTCINWMPVCQPKPFRCWISLDRETQPQCLERLSPDFSILPSIELRCKTPADRLPPAGYPFPELSCRPFPIGGRHGWGLSLSIYPICHIDKAYGTARSRIGPRMGWRKAFRLLDSRLVKNAEIQGARILRNEAYNSTPQRRLSA